MSRPVRFWGRLYQGQKQRDPKNMHFSIDDLQKMGSLKGKPIWLEHNAATGNIGEILESWVDARDGWLWIQGELYGADRIGNMHEEIRSKLVDGKLPDLSIHWVGQADSNDVVDPSSKAIIEASLTKQGFFNGTNLLSVAAHRDSNRKTLHISEPGHSISLSPPRHFQFSANMSQDIQALVEDIKNRYGIEITAEDARKIAPDGTGLDAALLVLDSKLNALSSKKKEEMSEKEMELLNRSRMSDEEKQELEKLRQWREQAEQQYAEEQGKVAQDLYSVIESRIPENKRSSIQEQLTKLASRSDYAPVFETLKLFGTAASESTKSADEYLKQITRSKKEYNTLLKERDTLAQSMQQASAAQPAQVEVGASSSFAMKRGIDKAYEPPAKQIKQESLSKPIEQMASAEAASVYFTKALSNNSNDIFNSTLDSLVASAKLKPGMPTFIPKTGFNPRPQPNADGIIPWF
jgi:hypothetical protein